MRYTKNFLYCFFILFFVLQKITIICNATTGPKRPILIFLDTFEFEGSIKGGAVFGQLANALNQECCPILLSGSLLANLSSRYTVLQKQTEQELRAKIERFRKDDPRDYDKADVYLEAAQFDPNRWVIKEINSSLYMLLPITYLEKLHINKAQTDKLELSEQLTQEELTLGLKINHLKTISLQDVIEKPSFQYYFISAIFNGEKSSIFCFNKDYKKADSIKQPNWVIFIMGHGGLGSMVAGLSIIEFKGLLYVLTTKIRTSLLTYLSCFATGLNIEKVYKENQSKIQNTYPYAIITNSITDAAVLASVGLLLKDKPQFSSESRANFKKFVSITTDHDTINYNAAAKSVFINDKYDNAIHIPQIKLPGLEWFSVLGDDKQFFSIGKNLAASRTKPLNINKYSKSIPKVILLYADYIPFEIIIEKAGTEAIISMLPGVDYHYIKKVSSPITLRYLAKIFTYAKPGLRKAFMIKEIEINSKIWVPDRTIIHNVQIVYNPANKEWEITYFKNNKPYMLQGVLEVPLKKSAEEIEKEKELWRNLSENKSNAFTPSNINNFDFRTELQKRIIEREILLHELLELQNQLGIIHSIRKA